MTSSYMARVIRLRFLAPAMVETILNGTQPVSVHRASLTATTGVDLAWMATGAISSVCLA